MRHLKIYESFNDPEVGDYVRIKRVWDKTDSYFRGSDKFDMNNIYVIIEINKHNMQPYVVKNIKSDRIAYCYYTDIELLSEEEIQVIKYNL